LSKSISLERIIIARRLAQELEEGQIVNLGVGIPTLVPDYLEEGKIVYLQSENGLLGMGPTPKDNNIDMDVINASKLPVTTLPGAAIFDSVDAFSMIRGGHVDVALLGALQVDETGELANWTVPGQDILGVGGAMDLVMGAKKVVLGLSLQSKTGESKLVRKLTYPTSGVRKADKVVTEKAVFEFIDGRMYLIEIDSEMTVSDLRKIVEAEFEVSPHLLRITANSRSSSKV
jgi:3-oxoacid CoA-transferase B subunit